MALGENGNSGGGGSTKDRLKRLRASAARSTEQDSTTPKPKRPDVGDMISAAMGGAKPSKPAPAPQRGEAPATAPKPRKSLVRSMMADIEREAPRAAAARAKPADKPRRARESVGLAAPRATPPPRQTQAVKPAASARSEPAPARKPLAAEPDPVERARSIARRLRKDRTAPAEPPKIAAPPPEPAPPPVAPRSEKSASPRAAPPPLVRDDVWSLPRESAAPSAPAEKLAPRKLRTAKTPFLARFEWDIASRYLRARRKEGFISVIAGFSLLGIALGVATLIIVMAVMTGFRETLIEQILGVNPHINVVSQTEKFENFDSLGAAIREVEGVERVWPSIEGQVLASSASGHSGVIVRGIRQDDLRQLKIVSGPEMSAGSVDEFQRDRGIAVGEGVARKLGLRVGDSLTLVTPDGDLTPFGITPRSKSYPVIYIYKLGLSQYDSAFVYMPLEEAQLYFNKKGVVDSLEVIVDDPNAVESYRQPIQEAARASIGVYTWKDLQGSLIGALDVERKVMFIILTLIILVAALNIISGLVMLVKDKTRDIAIMRTMGMSRGSVLRIFFICGASIGVVGAIAGTILGVLFTFNISAIQGFIEGITGATLWDPEVRFLSEVPARLQASDVLLTLAIALGLSFLATLYPAWRAAKLDPVEALRYE